MKREIPKHCNDLDRIRALENENNRLEAENKKLNEFKTKREESMFYFKAQMERAEPKTASEAEDLQRAKEIFEKLYREELYSLEQENKKLKEDVDFYYKSAKQFREENEKLREELSAYDREYFDEDKKAKNIFMEEDTLQELRDLGKI